MGLDDCIEATGGRDRAGYVIRHVYVDGVRKTTKAHRVAWAEEHGPIPEGMCVCHSCDNPACINLEHLWLGTHADNARDRMLKKRNGSNGLKERTHCKHGHEFTPENTYGEGSKRRCRACSRQRSKEFYWRSKEYSWA